MIFPVDITPGAVVVARSAVWIASGAARSVLRLNPSSGERTPVPLDDRPRRIAVGAGSVWVLTDAGVVRIDPHTLRVRDTIPAPADADALALSASHGLWLALYRANAAQRYSVSP
jgi:streptogramin lyase